MTTPVTAPLTWTLGLLHMFMALMGSKGRPCNAFYRGAVNTPRYQAPHDSGVRIAVVSEPSPSPLCNARIRCCEPRLRSMIRFLTAGESHGSGIVVILEGVPAGLAISEAEIQGELGRRRLGFGRGPRMRFEKDELSLIGGIRHGRTLGSPIAVEIKNTEWPKWQAEMSPAPGVPSKVLSTPR